MIFGKRKSPFTPKVKWIRLRLKRKSIQVCLTHFSNNKRSTNVYLESFLLISMFELDHWRSAANTMRYLCYLTFNYCRFAAQSELHFAVFINFEEKILEWDEWMHVHIYSRTTTRFLSTCGQKSCQTTNGKIKKWCITLLVTWKK